MLWFGRSGGLLVLFVAGMFLFSCADRFRAADDELFYLSGSADLPRAAELCDAIVDTDLRGRCQFALVGRVTQHVGVESGLQHCLSMAPSVWRDECVHSLIQKHGLELSDVDADAICQQSGTLQDSCHLHQRVHQMSRWSTHPDSFGQERERYDALLIELGDQQRPMEHRARQMLLRSMVTRLSAAGRLDWAMCGELTEEFCSQAFAIASVLWVGQAGQGKSSGDSPDAAPLVALGRSCEVQAQWAADNVAGIPWSEDADRVAQRAWRLICAEFPGSHRSLSEVAHAIGRSRNEPFGTRTE